jgi:hypothetical protein
MGKGQYVVYERASRDEESFFLIMAKKVVQEAREPKNWRVKTDPDKKHPGGRKTEYGFKQMLLVLLLMVYHRKEYREMEAHLKNNPLLVAELGLKKAPSKSSIQRAASRIGVETLAKLNDSITDRFKKIMDLEEPRV